MKPHLLLLFLLVACTAKQEKDTSVLFATEEAEADTLQYYDLHEIQSSGTIIAGTLSGPDTYYEYHGNGMGLQYRLAEAFAQSIGVVLQMEISPDTTSLLQKLKQGEIDFIALEMPTWQTREDEPLLRGAITEWWKPDRVKQIESTANNTTVTVRRRMRPVMQDAAHGIISAFDDLFRRYSSTAGWDWRLLAAMSYQESGFDPQAVSSMGAMGLMQLMPSTADAMGVPRDKRFDPEQNISASTRYIRKVSQSFSDIKDAEERIKFTLAAYNGGVGHVQDAQTLTRKAGRDHQVWQEVAPFILHLSEPRYYRDPDVLNGYMRGSETEAYVRLIMNRWNQYRGSARSYTSGSTPAPARKSLQEGEYKSVVKPAEEWVPEE
ncbi:MAG: transglycosylase SLT domain-containing protein [Bacteroidaceae bacterium]|nr:transglycosylase SLT domain-containing protein [Bacteroidaceae bacterium]MBQ6225133.1 transglycosylase SLT domain-containing protein [Bacteroidaceae bacterium]